MILTTDDLFAAIDHFLTSTPYYPCLLVVHPEIARLHITTQQILKKYTWPSLSIGTVVSQELLPITLKQRPRQATRAFANAVKRQPTDPVLCTDIDLLFEPSLSLDPLRLFREASRQARLAVTWPGTFTHGVLAYAVSAHTHYQTWTDPDLCDYCIITL